MLRSNPYVYPFVPFQDLSNKNITVRFDEDRIASTTELKFLVDSLSVITTELRGKTTSERILSIFTDDSVRFGPVEYITDMKAIWLKRFSYFIEKNIPLEFTLLGFPCKVPVPLKTNRRTPDMGEVLVLKRLVDICNEIAVIYKPGAIITIITEGIFGKFNGLSPTEYEGYENTVRKFAGLFDWNKQLKFTPLGGMEKADPDFNKRFATKVQDLKKRYADGDLEFQQKFDGTWDPQYRIMNTRDMNVSEELLMDVYNDGLSDNSASRQVRSVRNRVRKKVIEKIFNYFAYLMVRDDIDFINNTVPHALTLSVSPKPDRLGIIPVNKESIRLPHHGIPVYNRKKNAFTIEYLIDVKRSNNMYRKVYWKHDQEHLPFYYELL